MSRQELMDIELNRIKQVLIDDYGAKKIIVFGSYAEHLISEDSDLDIMVVKNTNEKFTKRIKNVMLLTKPSIATDFLVYNEHEISEMVEENNSFFLSEILEKGQVIFNEE